MAQTELDMTKLMILLQRRLNVIREINRLTGELDKAMVRNDEVSIGMILQMRADEMAKIDECTYEIWQMAGTGREAQNKLRLLMTSDPDEQQGETPEEKKVYEIRRKTQVLLDELRAVDERLNRKMTGDRSFYATKDSEKGSDA